ncbi:hypothetical protein EVG20_g11158 [Dentipellis fragilis]|uniref:Uncharacterized protein n=1 Tax=Dentipellis fragilis TaxID=205917 RepID=A0A4Y9XRF6_9AGAM|nr:hypothetical protein EVG20_g11158 [Dentipellis fragilis]
MQLEQTIEQERSAAHGALRRLDDSIRDAPRMTVSADSDADITEGQLVLVAENMPTHGRRHIYAWVPPAGPAVDVRHISDATRIRSTPCSRLAHLRNGRSQTRCLTGSCARSRFAPGDA